MLTSLFAINFSAQHTLTHPTQQLMDTMVAASSKAEKALKHVAHHLLDRPLRLLNKLERMLRAENVKLLLLAPSATVRWLLLPPGQQTLRVVMRLACLLKLDVSP